MLERYILTQAGQHWRARYGTSCHWTQSIKTTLSFPKRLRAVWMLVAHFKVNA